MSIPYTSEDFTTPRAGGESWVEYPFIEYGDNSSKVYHMRCTVNKSDYAAIALDTTMASASNADVLTLPFAADTSAYFVGDFNHRVTDGALLEFDRQFATIPATNEVYPGTEFFTFPGLPAVGSSAITIISDSYSNGISTFNTNANHNMQAGDLFKLIFAYIVGSSTITSNAYLNCTTGTTGTTIKTNSIIASYNLNYSVGVLLQPNVLKPRLVQNLPSSVKITNEYYLPGVTSNVTTQNDIPILQTFNPINQSNGLHTDNLLGFSSIPTTTPTAEDYRALIDAQDYIVKDCTIQRYKGNIYVRKTKKIVAT